MIGVFCRYGDPVTLSVVNAPKPVISCPMFSEMRRINVEFCLQVKRMYNNWVVIFRGGILCVTMSVLV